MGIRKLILIERIRKTINTNDCFNVPIPEWELWKRFLTEIIFIFSIQDRFS